MRAYRGVAAAILGLALTAAAQNDNSPDAAINAPRQFKAGGAPGGMATTGGAGEAYAGDGAWWGIFHDATLNKLETEAIATNQDLRQSVARVMLARAQARAAEASFFPAVTAPLQASRFRTTNTGPVIASRLVGNNPLTSALGGGGGSGPASFEGQAVSTLYDDYQAGLALSYEVDVFGRIRHTYGEAAANARATAADRQAVQLSLTSQVAANYFSLRALDSEVAILQRTTHLRGDAVHIQDERLKAGKANDMDLSRAQLEQANTDADLTGAAEQRTESENALAALCGQDASEFHVAAKPLGETRPPELPAAVPAQLLTRRPDLIEARHRLIASGEGIDAARAELLPTFNIAANYGYESSEFSQLLENQSRAWTITGGVSIPIFEGGRNGANLKAAKAERDAALAAYRQTALTAFQEAEDALSALRERAAQAEARGRATGSAQRVFDAAQKSYQEGAIDYFEVIDAQRSLLAAEVSQVETLDSRYAATIELIKAMGGWVGGGDGK